MAIQVWDGYDHYNDVNDFSNRSGFLQYNPTSGAGNVTLVSFITGRDGIQLALNLSKSSVHPDYLAWVFQQRVASAYVGFAVKTATGWDHVWEFWDSVAQRVQLSVLFRSDNFSITLFRGNAFIGSTIIGGDGSGVLGTQLAITGNNVWVEDEWHFLEMWPRIDNTTGAFQLWLKGIEITALTVSNVDTQVTANAWWDIMHLQGNGVQTDAAQIDDFYYGDTTSPGGQYPFVAPIGDSHTQTLFATGNNSVQFTPLANTNYQEINEVAMDSDSSYNFSSTLNNEDTFVFSSLPASIAYVFGVQLTGAYRKDNSGTRAITQTVISTATQVYGSSHSLGDNLYSYYSDVWTLDPHTSALWTKTAVNALLAGYHVAV